MASIPAAHGAAYELRNEHPKGLTIKLAPNPKDIASTSLLLSNFFLTADSFGRILVCQGHIEDFEGQPASSY